MEVDRARAKQKIILPYIVKEGASWPTDQIEALTNPLCLEPLNRFKCELQQGMADFFTDPASLDGPLSRAILQAIKTIEDANRAAAESRAAARDPDAPYTAGSSEFAGASTLTTFVSAALVNQVSALSAEISGATNAELELHETWWREGRRAEVRAWLAPLLKSPAKLAAMNQAVVARVLRFAAGTALDENDDPVEAMAWLAEARALDPDGDDIRLRAVLLARGGNREAALSLLADTTAPSDQNLRAALLLEVGRLDDAEEILDVVEATAARAVAETWRLRAFLRLGRHDLVGAVAAAIEAQNHAPRVFAVRFLTSVLQYFQGLIPAVLPSTVPRLPQLMDPVLVRRDAEAVRAFRTSAEGFAGLMDSSVLERRDIETWRLAALANVVSDRSLAVAFADQTLARDPSHPHVLLWATCLRFELDVDASFDALDQELGRGFDLDHACAYIGACLAVDRVAHAAARLDQWRLQFTEADALPKWAFWRAQAALAAGDIDRAETLQSELQGAPSLSIQAALLEHEARRTGDGTRLVAHLESSAAATGNPRYLLDACEWRARVDDWSYVKRHIDMLTDKIPTPEVRRLAIYARYKTGDDAGCVLLADAAIAHPQEGYDQIELRRLRACALEHSGQIIGAIDDLTVVVTTGEAEPRTRDLMALARLHFLAGHSHEVAVCARRLRGRVDLTATGALMLAGLLAHDDRLLARELWHLADGRLIPSEAVTTAIGLGFQLGLDEQLGALTGRLATLAVAGHQGVQQFTIDQFISMQHEWADQRHRALEQYRHGEATTHVVAQLLNLPLAHLYHVTLSANEASPMLRGQFALQLRDGGRGVPGSATVVAAPGRLAMDMSALLLAAHLDLLTLVEQQFAPLRLSQLVMAGLHEQRDRLKPHQPSRLAVNDRLLQAERRGRIRCWEGELPTLGETDRAGAGNWLRWIALLERARREQAFVLDLPLSSESPPHGRPVAAAGPERLARLVSLATVRAGLRGAGRSVSFSEEPEDEGHGRPEDNLAGEASDLPIGSVLYLTDSGAEALVSAGLLDAAAETYTVLVDPDDQELRRAHLATLREQEDQIAWIDGLIRRVSDGLTDGRYELLPVRPNEGETGDGRSGTGEASDGVGQLPMVLRLLRDLLELPAGTVDAIWIEDRWLNRHRLVGSARVTDVLEVVAVLEAAGRLTSGHRWDLWLRLRAANVRILPLSADEILHHLMQAPFADGKLVETPPLRVLRQSAAAVVEDAGTLRIPPRDVLATGILGDLEVVRSYVRAIHEVLVAIWKSGGDLKEQATRSRVEARSRWVTDNLYLDMGLLRARVVHPGVPPEPGVSAAGVAGLVVGLIQLLSKEAAASEVGDGDARAKAYARWVCNELIAGRAKRDPEFRAAVLERFSSHLTSWQSADLKSPVERFAARTLAGRAYDALPEPLRAELATRAEFMEYAGRRIVNSISIDGRSVAIADLATACAAAAHGQMAEVPVLGSEPPMCFAVSFTSPDVVEVKAPDGTRTILSKDPAFCVFAADEEDRRTSLLAFRATADVSAKHWNEEIERLGETDDPGERLSTLLKYRQGSVRQRYRLMVEHWRIHGRLDVGDLTASAPEDVLAHLRFPADPASEEAWGEAWESAGATLIKEEGPEEAFHRMSGLPLPLSGTMMDHLRGLSVGERRALVRRLLVVPVSPVGLIQGIRALAVFGDDEPVYHRLAMRLVHRVASPEWQIEVALLRVVALAALEDLEVRGTGVGTPGACLISSWYHAHRFVGGILATGGDLPRLVEALDSRPRSVAGTMFDAVGAGDRDVAHPRHIVSVRLALAGLQYASAGTRLFKEAGKVPDRLIEGLSMVTPIGPAPNAEILRDMTTQPNALGTWLAPARESDGSVVLGLVTVVPELLSPSALRAHALEAIRTNPFDPTPWFTIEIVEGQDALTGTEAESFDAAIAEVDVSDLIQRLAPHALVVMGRLARQAVAAGSSERRTRLREAIRTTVAAEWETAGRPRRVDLMDAPERGATEDDDLSPTQLGALGALYILSLAESTRGEAMSALARDLADLGRQDVAFLRRARGTLEKLVAELALAEAHVFTSLLAEARGS
jgi:hypothetical protein